MASVEKILQEMRNNPQGIRFAELLKVCEHHFGEPRIHGSHHFFAMPWKGDPRVDIQNFHNKAKPYQVRQALSAIDRLKEADNA